jgi:hypothetical protein
LILNDFKPAVYLAGLVIGGLDGGLNHCTISRISVTCC